MLRKLPVGERTIARPAGLVISVHTDVPLDRANNGTMVDSKNALKDWENARGVLTIPPYPFDGRVQNVACFMAGTVFGPTFGLDVPQFWSICLTNAVSDGFVSFTSNNPDDPPVVSYTLLKEKSDWRRMTNCMKRMKDIHAAFPERFGVVDVQPVGLVEEIVG